jgi:type IV pilus assembly protein PilQ
MAEPRTNQLFVTDIAERVDQVAQMIAKIDIPLRQVMIEARIVQASDTFGQTLGVRLGGMGQGGAQSVWGPTNTNAMANANPTAQQATSFNIKTRKHEQQRNALAPSIGCPSTGSAQTSHSWRSLKQRQTHLTGLPFTSGRHCQLLQQQVIGLNGQHFAKVMS